jgi:hypothetical protein
MLPKFSSAKWFWIGFILSLYNDVRKVISIIDMVFLLYIIPNEAVISDYKGKVGCRYKISKPM